MALISDFLHFISSNAQEDSNKLRLSLKQEKYPFDLAFAIDQIECRKKCAFKLGKFIENPEFLFPDVMSSEQSTHQSVAKFHAMLLQKGCRVLDMTAGLGIDSFTFADSGALVTAVELSEQRAKILESNKVLLKLDSLKIVNDDSIEYLKNSKDNYDVIFVDPSRRDNYNKRLYNFRDCSPNIIDHLELILNKADNIFIKASPLIDITQTIRDLKNIKKIFVIGVKGECKEVLIELQGSKVEAEKKEIITEAINLDNNGELLWKFLEIFTLQKEDIPYARENDILPGKYILEPSPLIMKLSPWKSLSDLYKAKKLGGSSNLFITDIQPQDFPGRVTSIQKILKSKERKNYIGFPATIISRNYPKSSEDLRKEFRLKEGDENFIYATRVGNKPILILSKKITLQSQSKNL